jgi:hypothetical protein
MKVYVKRPVAAKVAQALATHPDPDVQALARHLAQKGTMESRFLTADELDAILTILDIGLDLINAQGGSIRTGLAYRRTKAARPKLVSFLESTRKREAQGLERDEDEPAGGDL